MVHPSGGGCSIVDTLDDLDLSYPKVDPGRKKELEAAKKIIRKRVEREERFCPNSASLAHSSCWTEVALSPEHKVSNSYFGVNAANSNLAARC